MKAFGGSFILAGTERLSEPSKCYLINLIMRNGIVLVDIKVICLLQANFIYFFFFAECLMLFTLIFFIVLLMQCNIRYITVV